MLVRPSCAFALLLVVSGCGGSSSETPPPLPPTPANEPYRTGDRPRPPRKHEQAQAPEATPTPAPRTARPTGSADGTWGSSALEPLPELAPK